MAILKKLRIELSYDPAIPFLDMQAPKTVRDIEEILVYPHS